MFKKKLTYWAHISNNCTRAFPWDIYSTSGYQNTLHALPFNQILSRRHVCEWQALIKLTNFTPSSRTFLSETGNLFKQVYRVGCHCSFTCIIFALSILKSMQQRRQSCITIKIVLTLQTFWKAIQDPQGSSDHILRTTDLNISHFCPLCCLTISLKFSLPTTP